MKKYDKYSYIFPPRAEHKISADSLDKFDINEYLGQPKFNGSCCLIFTDGKKIIVKNRHNTELSNFKLNKEEILSLHTETGWLVLVGEYMNKNKKYASGEYWNHKLVIFDILVKDGQYLLDTTFEERVKILDDLYGTNLFDNYMYQISDNIYRVKTFYNDFFNIWNEIVKIDMLEGLVLKKRDGKLERGTREKNNISNQLKCRKSTKNYEF